MVIKRKILKTCAYPDCEVLEDPRWGGFCDGHGIAPLDDRNVVIIHLRNKLEKAADPELLQLLDLLSLRFAKRLEVIVKLNSKSF